MQFICASCFAHPTGDHALEHSGMIVCDNRMEFEPPHANPMSALRCDYCGRTVQLSRSTLAWFETKQQVT